MRNAKLFFVVALLLAGSYGASAQVMVDGVDINKQEGVKYVQLLGTAKFMSTKITVNINYGQEVKAFSGSQKIDGPDGKTHVFNSMVDALNFMEDNGWEYVNSYAITVGNQNVYHYLLKRKE